MTNNSFFVFLILCGTLKTAYCGNEPFNLFGLQPSKQTAVEGPEFSKSQEKLSSDGDATAIETKNLKKKRFFQDNDPAAEIHSDKYFLNGEYSTKRSGNQENSEDQQKSFENMRTFASNHWENERNGFPFSEEKENLGNSMEFRPRDPTIGPNQKYDLERSSFSDKGQPQWNAENNFKFGNPNLDPRVVWNGENNFQFGNPNLDQRVGSSFNGRSFSGNINGYYGARDRNTLDRKISITTLNEAEMRNLNRYRGDFRINDMHSGYQMHSNMDYNKRKDDSFWNPNPYKYDKGVIINFNTECPTPGQFNNQLVHRVIVSPKSPLTQSEISTFQLPGGGLISSHQLAPTYYM